MWRMSEESETPEKFGVGKKKGNTSKHLQIAVGPDQDEELPGVPLRLHKGGTPWKPT